MLPELSIIVLSYKRPWYTLITLDALMNHIHYDGTKKIIVSDGGSPEWQLQMYRESMRYYPHEILSVRSGSVSDMMNQAVERAGEVWIMTLDDFYPRINLNITNDVQFLLQNPDVGHLRYGNMNAWDVPQLHVYAELKNIHREHYWVIDKSRTECNTIWTMGFSMMHRRMWNAYGPIDYIEPHQPGEVENQMNRQFRERSGPTVAIPMKIWQEAGMSIPLLQPIAHVGHVRTDEYTKLWNQRWGAT